MDRERRAVVACGAYELLLKLFPHEFRQRFAKGMLQNYGDLCRARQAEGGRVWTLVVSIFFETSMAIVRERREMSSPRSRPILRWFAITAVLLCVALVANRSSDEFTWAVEDFLTAGALILFAGLGFEALARRWVSSVHRVASALAVLTAFLMVWMTLAVGLIGSEDHPANLLYGVVLLIVVAGVTLAGRRPVAMARTLFVTAGFQFLIPFLALLIWRPDLVNPDSSRGLLGIVALNTVFTVLFGLAGWLFRHPARLRAAEA